MYKPFLDVDDNIDERFVVILIDNCEEAVGFDTCSL